MRSRKPFQSKCSAEMTGLRVDCEASGAGFSEVFCSSGVFSGVFRALKVGAGCDGAGDFAGVSGAAAGVSGVVATGLGVFGVVCAVFCVVCKLEGCVLCMLLVEFPPRKASNNLASGKGGLTSGSLASRGSSSVLG